MSEDLRNKDGTFKKGVFDPNVSRKVFGKYIVPRRPKSIDYNVRGKWQYQEDRPSCVNSGLPAR